MTKTQQSQARFKLLTWLLFVVAVVAVYLTALDVPLLGPDEPRYTQVAREMYLRGDWVSTTLGGFNWFEKPALLYWLQHASFLMFGVSEFGARFGSAVFGLGTAGAMYLLGKTAGDETDSSSSASYFSFELKHWMFLIAATSLGLIVFSRGASFDIIITFPLAASLTGFFLYDNEKEKTKAVRYVALVTFYVFIGIGLIAKGLIGIVFPFAIVAFYLLLSRRWPTRHFHRKFILGFSCSVGCCRALVCSDDNAARLGVY